jgi:hypothetical protein
MRAECDRGEAARGHRDMLKANLDEFARLVVFWTGDRFSRQEMTGLTAPCRLVVEWPGSDMYRHRRSL